MKNLLIIVFSAIFLASCGGGSGSGDNGGTSGSLPPSRPAGTIQGSAAQGLISNATVTIYNYTGGSKGEVLGTGTTDSKGQYSISIVSPDVPVLIEVTQGNYKEEATNQNVLMGSNVLRAVSQYTSGQSYSVQVTSYTNIAAGYAKYLIANGSSVSAAIAAANKKFSDMLGFDILKTKPIMINDNANASTALNDGLKYGFMLAAISDEMNTITNSSANTTKTTYTSVDFSNIAYQDIQDGAFDGKNNGAQLSFGTIPVTSDDYRYNVAISMLDVASSSVNQTGIPASDLGAYATQINNNTDTVYGTTQPVSLGGTGPVINSTNITDGSILNGVVPFIVSASDTTGIASIKADIGAATSVSLTSAVATNFDTSSLTDGSYTITVTVTDNVGLSATVTKNVQIINSAGDIKGRVLSKPLVNATVTIYDFTNMTKGAVLGTGNTNSTGNYDIAVRAMSGPVLVEATGGSYIEPTSNINVSLATNQYFDAVVNFTHGSTMDVAVNPFTTFAAAKAIYLNTLGVDDQTAINSANGIFNDILGIDILTTQPDDVTNAANYSYSLNDQLKYGYLIDGISQWTLDESTANSLPPHQVYNTAEFTRLGAMDIEDDGQFGSSTPVMIGPTALTPDVYRHDLAVSAMKFVNSTYNVSGITNATILNYLEAYNNSANSMFNSSPVIAMDENYPAISSVTPANGTSVNNTLVFNTSVTDLLGLTSGVLKMDGTVVQNLAVNNDQKQTFNTAGINTVIGDGPHTFEFDFTNVAGTTTTSGPINLYFDNTPPNFTIFDYNTNTVNSYAGQTLVYNNSVTNWDQSTDTCTYAFTVAADREKPLNFAFTDAHSLDVDKAFYVTTGVFDGTHTDDLYGVHFPMQGSMCHKYALSMTDSAGNNFVMAYGRPVYQYWFIIRTTANLPTGYACVVQQQTSTNYSTIVSNFPQCSGL